jgi:hypothetical protein
MSLLTFLASAPDVRFLVDRVSPGYAAPDVPTGALHPIWGMILSGILVGAVVAVSLMTSRRSPLE